MSGASANAAYRALNDVKSLGDERGREGKGDGVKKDGRARQLIWDP